MKHDTTRRRTQRTPSEQEIGGRIVDDSPLAVYVFQDGCLKSFNDALVELSGYGRKELSRIDYLALIHPDFRDAVVRQTELALAGATSGLPQSPEIQVLRKDAEVRWVQITPHVIEYHGRPAILGIVLDVSDRKRAEESLRESEARYRLLAENLADVVWVVDFDEPDRLTYVSPSVKQLLGYSVEEAMSVRIAEVFTPTSIETVTHGLASVARTADGGLGNRQKPVVLHLELIRKDGSTVPVEVKYAAMRGAGAYSSSILAVARDMTERRALEAERLDMERKAQLASRLASVGQMAAGIAHEVNNPLSAAVGFTELLAMKDLPKAIKSDVEIIHRSAKRAASILSRMLTFARQLKPELTLSSINEILETTLEMRAYDMETAKIKLTKALAPDLPLTMADASQLQHAFLNLLLNAEMAIKDANRPGNILVMTEKEGDIIRVTIEDDGVGIPPENMGKIFDPFFTTREVGQGAGLGLSVCHGIVGQHGGRVHAESELGKGASFIVELPIVFGEKPADLPWTAKTLKTPRTVRVVRDDGHVRASPPPVVRRRVSADRVGKRRPPVRKA